MSKTGDSNCDNYVRDDNYDGDDDYDGDNDDGGRS